MTVAYHDLLRGAALRVNALEGAQAAALETTYLTGTLSAANFKSATFPFTAIKAAILMAEGKLAAAIGDTGNHPWRQYLVGVTALLAHETALPKLDANSKPIIGAWGSVYDGSDGTACTEQPLEVIRRRVRNANSFFRTPVYHYKLDGGRIYHTRTSVYLDCCVYDRAAQKAAMDANGNMLLPDALEEALICGALSYLVRDDAFVNQAGLYRAYFNETEAGIRAGLTSVSAKVVPGPTLSPNAP